jgi:hypothetical protein
MAIVVLLNLDIMFVDKKKRELIVLMINGFSVKDAKAYIYRDSLVPSRWPCCSMRCARFRASTSRTSTASSSREARVLGCVVGRPLVVRYSQRRRTLCARRAA